MSIPSRGGVIRQAGSEAAVSPAVLEQNTPFAEASTVEGADVKAPARPSMADILRGVSHRYHIPVKHIASVLGRNDARPRGLVVLARNEACWLMRQQGYKFTQIGKFINRHHSSIMHNCKQHEARMARADEMPWVILRVEGLRVYAAPVGYVKPYTRSLNRARRWRTYESALELCEDNERVAHVLELTS